MKTRLLRSPGLWHNYSMLTGLFSGKNKAFCAFCKLNVNVYKSKDLGIFDIAVVFATVTLSAFQWFSDLKLIAIIFFPVIIFFMQFFIRMRWRESLKCTHCGFDPVKYKKNPSESARAVKEFLQMRNDDPRYLLRSVPQLPVLKKTEEDKKALAKIENKIVASKSKSQKSSKSKSGTGKLLDKSF